MISKNGNSNKKWHWIGYEKKYFDWFRDVCDYVDVEVLINPSNIDWDLVNYAISPNHDVIVGYWQSRIGEEDIARLHKLNIKQNRGTAANIEALIADIESRVTELEACFSNPKEALIEYATT